MYNIERWNTWNTARQGEPEPLSGYVGMISLCKGATPPSQNGVPAKVVVCLTARSERMKGEELRISQSKGVRETMRYADLLNPLSTRSIIQINMGVVREQQEWEDTWKFVTGPFVSTVDSAEELLSSPSLYWSLKGGEESLFHLQDLVPSSADEGEEEESVVMEFDLGSERPSFW